MTVQTNRRAAREQYPLSVDLQALGALLQERRRALELSQAQIGKRVAMSDREISNIELGRQMPSLAVFLNSCSAYALSAAVVLAQITIGGESHATDNPR